MKIKLKMYINHLALCLALNSYFLLLQDLKVFPLRTTDQKIIKESTSRCQTHPEPKGFLYVRNRMIEKKTFQGVLRNLKDPFHSLVAHYHYYYYYYYYYYLKDLKLGMVIHACNSCYSRGRDQEDLSSKQIVLKTPS
jgi:hypothetical protein